MQSLAALRICEPLVLTRRRSSGGGAGSSGGGGPRTPPPPGPLSVAPPPRGHIAAHAAQKLPPAAAPAPHSKVSTTTAAPCNYRRDDEDAPARATATTAAAAAAAAPAHGFLLGDPHSHLARAGDDAAHAPFSLWGNFSVVGPAAAVKMPDGSLLVSLPARGGGHVALPSADCGGAAAGPGPAVRLGADALLWRPPRQWAEERGGGDDDEQEEDDKDDQATRGGGRCVLHGELMQLSGAYRVLEPPRQRLPSWPGLRETGTFSASSSSSSSSSSDGDGGGGSGNCGCGSGSAAAVRRHCGGPRTHTGPIDVLTVAELPVGASLVLHAGARLSHPLNATPPGSSLEEEDEGEEEEGEGPPQQQEARGVAAAAAAALALAEDLLSGARA